MGSISVRDRRQVARIDVAIDRLALLADAAVVIDAEVAADADQPGLEVGAAVERVERLEDLEEDVLRQILGLVVLADELVGDVEHLAPVLADDLLPRLLIAGQAALDQLVDRSRQWRTGTQEASARRSPRRRGRRARGIITNRFFACQTRQTADFTLRSERFMTCVSARRPPGRVSRPRPLLSAIAAPVGTPAYVYDAAAIRAAYRGLDAAFGELSARHPLRAEGQFDAGARAPAARSSAAQPTPTRAARSRSRCAPASSPTRSCSPASARARRRARSRASRSA